MTKTLVLSCIGAVVVCALARPASAFCGFYVAGADSKLYNNATQVVLMRDGTLTVLSMQNNYQGPAEDFAMVVPVPQVLSEDNVKTLERALFDRVDALAAPRLVEYWEQDPCKIEDVGRRDRRSGAKTGAAPKKEKKPDADLGVTVEAEFKVAEYDIVILSAKEATGLNTWLLRENYKIPDNAAPLLEPYVSGGMKFFVAKVDPSKVTFKDGQAMLSPLRFHYESEDFGLPIRLGLINANGKQDLIVHILAKNKRYEVSNYANVTIPTNFDVKDEARDRFGEFYAALFDRTVERNAGAVVTEYSWDASSCDPCPTPPLSANDIETLGNDVIVAAAGGNQIATGAAKSSKPGRGRRPQRSGFVLTRLHARYDAGSVGDDLQFAEAPAIAGGRERMGADGALEHGSTSSGVNNFQARYAIRHEWTGAMDCPSPRRGVWGGPPRGEPASQAIAARDLAFAPRGKTPLGGFVKRDLADLDVKATMLSTGAAGTGDGAAGAGDKPPETSATGDTTKTTDDTKTGKGKSGCGCGASPSGGGLPTALLFAFIVIFAVTRRTHA